MRTGATNLLTAAGWKQVLSKAKSTGVVAVSAVTAKTNISAIMKYEKDFGLGRQRKRAPTIAGKPIRSGHGVGSGNRHG